jgi:1-acyl-sn-glycerol-3-phosphate acyltransferase
MAFAPPTHVERGLDTSIAARARRESFVLKTDAVLRNLVRLGYFSWDIEGVEHIPRDGPVVFVMNHAGWFALDTIIVGCSVAESIGVSRAPYFAASESALSAPVVGPFFRRLGGLPVSLFRHPQRLPAEFDSYGICPEGVEGNCKPFWEAYRMKEWNRGFVRLAMALKAQVVPVAVIGGEECLPVAWTVKVLEPLIGSILGLPLALVPLPTRWKVIFHEPVCVTSPGNPVRWNPEYCNSVARRLQGVVQGTLDREGASRPLGRLSSFVAAISNRARANAHGVLEPKPLLASEGPVPLPRPFVFAPGMAIGSADRFPQGVAAR